MINVKRTYTVYDALDGNTFTKNVHIEMRQPTSNSQKLSNVPRPPQ